MRQTVKRYNYLVIHTKIAEHVHWEIYYTKHEILHIYIPPTKPTLQSQETYRTDDLVSLQW